MDFALLPPEVNSARMYAGAGSGPMLAAASAWDGLAAELHSAAESYQSAITSLTAGPWLGPSSATMAAAAAPYITWMHTAAAQAEQTANQAVAAASAYEGAFAETVPPPVVAANRSLLAALVASNVFGQNTSAIATTETQYAEMWAQDAAAMQSYALESAAATTLRPFSSPTPNTDGDSQAGQAAAVTQATGTSAGKVQSALSAVPNVLTNFASPAAVAADPLSLLDALDFLADLSGLFVDPELSAAGLGIDSTLGITALPYDVGGFYTGLHTDDIVSGWAGIQTWPGMGSTPPTSFPVITPRPTAIAAGLADSTSVGRLSVPATWAAAAPEFRLSAVALPAANIAAAAEASASGTGSLFSQMALASMAGRAMAGTTGAGGPGIRQRIGAPTGKSKKSSDGDSDETPEGVAGGPITGISAELRELFSLRDAGILTEEEFTEQKRRLLPS
jgi:PPE-repeat protein